MTNDPKNPVSNETGEYINLDQEKPEIKQEPAKPVKAARRNKR